MKTTYVRERIADAIRRKEVELAEFMIQRSHAEGYATAMLDMRALLDEEERCR